MCDHTLATTDITITRLLVATASEFCVALIVSRTYIFHHASPVLEHHMESVGANLKINLFINFFFFYSKSNHLYPSHLMGTVVTHFASEKMPFLTIQPPHRLAPPLFFVCLCCPFKTVKLVRESDSEKQPLRGKHVGLIHVQRYVWVQSVQFYRHDF